MAGQGDLRRRARLAEPSGINGPWVAGPLSADTTIRVGGIVGTVINLLPLRVLPGGTIVDWNRLAWGALAVLALFVLLEVMIFPAHHPAHSSKTPLATTVVLFAVFAAFSLLFRQYFSIRNRKKTEEPESLGVSVEAEEAVGEGGRDDRGGRDEGEASGSPRRSIRPRSAA